MYGNKSTPSYVVSLPLEPTVKDIAVLDKRFEIARHIYNVMVKEAKRRLCKYQTDAVYKEIFKHRHKKQKLNDAEKEKLKLLQNQCLLTCSDFEKYLKVQNYLFRNQIGSAVIANIAKNVFDSVSKYIFKRGKKVKFKRYGQMLSLENKQNGVIMSFNKDEMLFSWLGLDILVHYRKNDYFIEQSLKNRIKYCRVVKYVSKSGKNKYKLQITVEGQAPLKIHNTGEIKHYALNADVGIDIGPSTVAVVSQNNIMLEELGHGVENIDNEIRLLQRHIDRQRRKNNPGFFDEKGRIKKRKSKKEKRKWKISKRMKKSQNKLRYMQYLRSVHLKEQHIDLAYKILAECGNSITVEDMNWKSLTARSKKTTKKADGTYRSKKRFGKSIKSHAPGIFILELTRIAKSFNGKVAETPCKELKASQYNHISKQYEPVSLSTRNKYLTPTLKVQRDLYSAFLMSNVQNNKINQQLCETHFDKFNIMQTELMNKLSIRKHQGEYFPSCMGIA